MDESDQFLKALYQNIKDTTQHELALDQLKRLQEKMKDEKDKNEILKQVNAFFAKQPEKMTLLELVANYEQPGGTQKMIILVLQLFPELLSQERVSNTTPTALHILVYNRNLEGVTAVTESAEKEKQLDKLLLAQVKWSTYQVLFCNFVSLAFTLYSRL